MKRWKEMEHVTESEFLRQVGIPRANFITILDKVRAYLDAERTRSSHENAWAQNVPSSCGGAPAPHLLLSSPSSDVSQSWGGL